MKSLFDSELSAGAAKVSSYLTSLGIRHAMIGGMALNYHGIFRSTLDIDFLVAEGAFKTVYGMVIIENVPLMVDGITIDYLTPDMVPDPTCLNRIVIIKGIPVISLTDLKVIKQAAPRARDKRDVEMIEEAGY